MTAEQVGEADAPDVADAPAGPSAAEVELAVLRRVLTVGLVVAIVVAAVAAAVTVHPLVGASLALVAIGAWWFLVTAREHQIRAATTAAAATARARGPFTPPGDLARPDAPPWAVKG